MVRPLKNNADYFSHDNNMRNNRKILALRAKFQHEGYAVFCMFLELLTEQNNFRIEIDEMELTLLARDFQTTKERLQDILNFCIEIRLINKENNTYFSQNHIERMNPLLHDRERKRLWRNEIKDGTNEVKDGTNPVIPRKVKESKVKESKVKESKVKESKYSDNKNGANAPTLQQLIEPLKSQYDENLINEFIEYWTEKNPNGKKERWQMQKVFDPARRLATWKRKSQNWGKPKKPLYETITTV